MSAIFMNMSTAMMLTFPGCVVEKRWRLPGPVVFAADGPGSQLENEIEAAESKGIGRKK